MKEKLLICGRSGSGKDTYAKELEANGLKGVCSYTTRPRRDGEGETHIFIKPEEVDNYPNKIAITEINGYVYFATKEQLEEADYYIIDPNGIEYLRANYPEIKFRVIYIYADYTTREARAIARGGEKEREIFPRRDASESPQFNAFEKNLYKENATIHNNNIDDMAFIRRCVCGDLWGTSFYIGNDTECQNCRFYRKEPIDDGYVCVNDQSPNVADWVNPHDICKYFDKKLTDD